MPNEFSHIFMRGGDKVLKFKQRQCFLTTGKRILKNEKDASSGNRTRAARVAGEHSTTEPTMPLLKLLQKTLPNQRYVLDVNQIRLRWATMKICL